MGVDDTTHSFNVHDIGSMVASLLVGVFCSPTIAGYDGFTVVEGGRIFHHWVQIGYQLAGTVAITAWTVVFTYAICFIADHIPGCILRISKEEELKGLGKLETEEFKKLESVLADMGKVEYLQADEASDSAGSQPQGSCELQDVKHPQPN